MGGKGASTGISGCARTEPSPALATSRTGGSGTPVRTRTRLPKAAFADARSDALSTLLWKPTRCTPRIRHSSSGVGGQHGIGRCGWTMSRRRGRRFSHDDAMPFRSKVLAHDRSTMTVRMASQRMPIHAVARPSPPTSIPLLRSCISASSSLKGPKTKLSRGCKKPVSPPGISNECKPSFDRWTNVLSVV